MGRPKKSSKPKEPVRLRSKPLSNGNYSLYLDYYEKGKREYEFLKLYLRPENTPEDRAANRYTLMAATAIKAQRLIAIINKRAGIKTSDQRTSLTEWIATLIARKRNKVSKSSIKGLERLSQHLDKYVQSIALIDIDKQFCIGFIDYLRTAKSLKTSMNSDPQKIKGLSQTTQAEMQNTLSIVLNEAVREGLIQSNAIRLLSPTEKIKTPDSIRDYLSVEELKRMIDTPVNPRAQIDKDAFLFCCFCGLRHSDVSELKWGNIVMEGERISIRIVQKKTKQPMVAILSRKAISFLPHRDTRTDDDKVFQLPAQSVTNKRLKKWAKDSNVQKNVTFHVSRHTFATLMLTAGVDIYTISKLMGHTNIATTQIYAKIVNKKKEEAVNLLDCLF